VVIALFVVAAYASVGVSLEQNQDVITDLLFKDFMVNHNKHYDAQELKYRFGIFKQNLKKMEEHNIKDSTFKIGINKFADMSTPEYLKSTHQSPQKYHVQEISLEEVSSVAPPTSLDWRTSTKPVVVGPVRNSGECGDSAAISIVDSISGDYAVSNSEDFYQFDDKYVTDCDGKGCSGQDINTIWSFISKFGLNWYYNGCPTGPGLGLCITGTNCTKSGSESDLVTAVAKYGPIPILVDASHSSFQLYVSGIYYEPQCSPSKLDHCLLLVGYGSSNGQDYWIARNSWGSSWGQKGDILLARNKSNNCGVATSACFAKNVHTCVCSAEEGTCA